MKNTRLIKGFSLLEILVTILLVAVGILGMVAMQGRAIQYTQDSVHRTHAVMLANELLEIVRANPSSLETNAEHRPLFEKLPAAATGSCVNVHVGGNLSGQLACWSRKTRALLPGAVDAEELFTSCLSTTPGTCTDDGAVLEIRLAWRATGGSCPRPVIEEDDDTYCLYTFRTQI